MLTKTQNFRAWNKQILILVHVHINYRDRRVFLVNDISNDGQMAHKYSSSPQRAEPKVLECLVIFSNYLILKSMESDIYQSKNQSSF